MKTIYKQKREQGFTIIEVMIVLAIAAVILLIVLLAVPALQRNSRNTQRNNDGAKLASAITTCLANHNNDITSSGCQSTSNLDITTQQLTTITPQTTAGISMPTDTKTADYAFGNTCNSSGTAATTTGASATGFAILFNLEGNGGALLPKCISS